jgi:hypothetical protein
MRPPAPVIRTRRLVVASLIARRAFAAGPGPHQHPFQFWTYARIKSELAAFTAGRDDWPHHTEFRAAGRLTLYEAIRLRKIRDRLATELGLRLPVGRDPIRTPSRWTDDAISAELDELLNCRSSWQTCTEFKAAGLSGLYHVLLKPGAREKWAREYGLKPPQRRRGSHAA